MGRRSDYKKHGDLAAYDLDPGCRSVINQSAKWARKMKRILLRIQRKRLNDKKGHDDA